MIYFQLTGSRDAKIGAETFRRAFTLSAVAVCILGIASQVAVARELRTLIYQPNDAARAAMAARVRDANDKQQALKFDASDLMNSKAKLFGSGHPPAVATPYRGTPAHDILGVLGFLFGTSEASAAPSAGPQVTGTWQTLPYSLLLIEPDAAKACGPLILSPSRRNPAGTAAVRACSEFPRRAGSLSKRAVSEAAKFICSDCIYGDTKNYSS
jgi:hypothetical protein